ncbi:MAG: hypothetical protein M3O02_02480 [Acidobacteriota bacterium]|nr:hypothetical protein [Acidobacteriota bacterium]
MPWLDVVLLALAALFVVLHFVHLKADFPNNSQWKDWAKYTDEGWYGDAAIRHYVLGHWNVPGDFNAAAALPVWPALELLLFRITGVSLTAARALSVTVFALTLGALYGLLRLWGRPSRWQGRRSLAPTLTVVLLAVSPFCFVFTRLAILEPLLVLLTVLALIAATRAGRAAAADGDSSRWRMSARAAGWAALLGALLPLAILTKTTALFLFPAILWMLYAGCAYRLWPLLRSAALAGTVAALLWGGYYRLFVRPRFTVDYRYLFSANTYTGFRWNTLNSLLLDTLTDAVWVGRPLFWLSLCALGWALVRIVSGGAKRNPLATTLLLWVLGYGAFLTYHANLQPRYYLVVAPPLTALVALAFEWIRARAMLTRTAAGAAVLTLASAAVAYTGVRAATHTTQFLLHPEYTWLSAAHRVQDIVDREAKSGHPRLLLSISGSELTLMTGVPSICDDFGTLNLIDRVARYRPGWFATWNDMEDDKMEALSPLYRVERVSAIPAFDDPDRNLLILYRLDPLPTPGAYSSRGRRRRPVFTPRVLRTPVRDRTVEKAQTPWAGNELEPQ